MTPDERARTAVDVRLPERARSLGFASVGVGAFDVDDERACSDEREDDLLGFVARVDVAMNQSRRNVEEPVRFHVRALAPARSELEPGATADHMAKHISIAVVVPAGRDAALRACTDEHCARRVERELTDESRRRRSRCQTVGADGPYFRTSALRSDVARLQLAETLPGRRSFTPDDGGRDSSFSAAPLMRNNA
jgi:hypothetical protein